MQRPTSVTVFGILNIVFAALGIVSVLAMVALFAVVGNTSNNPVVQVIHNNPAYAAWMKFSIALGLLAAAVLLVAGIGLLILKPWARILSIAYAIYAIVMVLVSNVVNFIYVLQPLAQQAHEQSGPQAAAVMGGMIGGFFGSGLGLIYPILLLIFMFRPNVAAAFCPQPSTSQPPATGQA